MKIVLVDDNESMRVMLRALCESQGHEVCAEFGDGVGLLEYVTENHPDVVCLDYELPGANGIELLKQMDATANHVDVVMVSGSEDPELNGKAADAGATGFIHKPFSQTQIIDELKEIEKTRQIAARAGGSGDDPSHEMALAETPAGIVPRTAVVVDDSGSIRILMKGILEALGIKVLAFATNGRNAIDVVQRTHPALVCMDVDMPIMTGVEALPQVHAASPQSKIVMITGNTSRAIVEAAIKGGAKGYFLKPIRPAKVEEFIKKLMSL